MTSLGPQFEEFFHASEDDVPPHQVRVIKKQHIFGGTYDAAMDRSDVVSDYRYLHHYRIPKSMIRPEIWADDEHDPDNPRHMQAVHDLSDHPGPTLFESVPVDPKSVKEGEVLQYRNQHEHKGHISYVIHKKDAQSGRIHYVGVTPLYEDDDDFDYRHFGENPNAKWEPLD